MAKRRQTTGLPRKRTPADQQAESGREYRSRAEREAEFQRYVLIGTGVAVAIVILILVAAVVLELLVNPNRTVATVDGETISIAQFEERVRLERAILNTQINNFALLLSAQGLDINQFAGQEPLRTWLSQVQIPDQLGNTVINTMVEDVLIRKQAEALGVSVTQENIDKQINDFLGFNPEPEQTDVNAAEPTTEPTITRTPFVSPTPSPVPTETSTPEPTEEVTEEATEQADSTPTFTPVPPTSTPTSAERLAQRDTAKDLLFRDITASARISQERLNQYFETLALRTAVRDAISTLTNEAPYVNARHILVNTEEEATDVLAALDEGESFADLAQAISLDTGSGRNGGELGWAAAIDFVGPFADAVADAEVGAIVGPVQTEFGWHIIQVRAREMREVTNAQLETAKDREFTQWLDNLRTEDEANIDISDIWADNIPDEPAFFLNPAAAGQSS